MIRFILSEKYSLLRAGISAILREKEDLSMVGEATTICETKQLIHNLDTEMILLCSNITDSTHELMELISFSCNHYDERRLLLITTLGEISNTYDIGELMAVGVSGCVLKEEGSEVLVNAIRTVAGGCTCFSRLALENSSERENERLAQQLGLTEHEKKLLRLLAHGLSNTQIAKELILAQQTVRNYTSTIYDKLGVSSRSEAVVWARESGFHET
jgi:DNA-binding NarL/FixJ family response regulator